MAKNMTRKGLALGAGFALAASGLVALPAQAAGELKMELNSGTRYAVTHQSLLYVNTSVTPGNDSGELAFLKYKITTGGSINVAAANGNNKTNAAADATTDVVLTTAASGVYAADTYQAGDAVNVLELEIEADNGGTDFAVNAASQSITVQAWIDKDGDGAIDAAEWQTGAQTLTWMDSDAVDITTVLTQPVLGDTTVSATVTSTNINLSQSTTLEVDFTESVGPGAETDTTGTYDAAADSLTFTTAGGNVADGSKVPGSNGAAGPPAVAATVVAGTYTATTQTTGNVTIGNTSTRAVSATTVNSVTAAVAAGDDNEALNANDTDARSGAGSLTLKYTVQDNAPAAIADKTVTLTLKENAINSLAAAASVTVGGKTLTNSSAATVQSVTATAVSDATGVVTFTVAWSGAVAGNVLSAEAKVDGVSSGVDTITFEDAAVATVHNLNMTSTNTQELYFSKTTAFTLNYSMVDQFGVLFTAANHSVSVSDGAVTNTGTFSGGQASVPFAAYQADGAKTMTATVFKNNAGTGITTTSEVTIGSPKAVAAVALAAGAGDSFGTAAAPEDLNLNAWTNADTRLGQNAPTVANANTAQATLTDSFGNATQGTVTFSGDGIHFMKDSELYTTGSITVQTTTAGVASVEIYSNTAGVKTLTATAGGVTTSKSVYFATAKDDTGTTVTASAPAYAKPGSTFKVTFTVTDKFGNPVITDTAATGFNNGTTAPSFSVTYTGPGLIVGTLPTATDANGQASVSVLLGSSDTGSISVVASYDGDTASTTNTTVGSATASVTVGTAPAAAADTKVNAGSFKGYVAIYAKGHEGKRLSAKVGNDWVVVPALASNFVRVVEYTGAGYTIAVRIYIDRVLVDTITVTTK